MRFREVKFLEAAEFHFYTYRTAVVAVVLRVIRHKTEPYPYRILFSRRAHGTVRVPAADIRRAALGSNRTLPANLLRELEIFLWYCCQCSGLPKTIHCEKKAVAILLHSRNG